MSLLSLVLIFAIKVNMDALTDFLLSIILEFKKAVPGLSEKAGKGCGYKYGTGGLDIKEGYIHKICIKFSSCETARFTGKGELK